MNNYIDSGSGIGQKNFTRKTSKKNSLFFQQAQKESNEEKFVKDVEALDIFRELPEMQEFKQHFKQRNDKFFETIEQIIKVEGSVPLFAKSFSQYGTIISDTGITIRENAPAAKKFYVYGEFNNWKKDEFELTKDAQGRWEIFLPRDELSPIYPIQPDQAVRYYIQDANDQWVERKSVWANSFKYTGEETTEVTIDFPNYAWKHTSLPRPASFHAKEYTLEKPYHQYAQEDLSQIASSGYNTLLIKYSSREFIFAPQAKLGTPADFKELIDSAHGLGLYVLLEVDYSQYLLPESYDGSNLFGENGQYDLSKWEVLRLLLSNLKFYIKEYQVDGIVIQSITKLIFNGFKQIESVKDFFDSQINFDGLTFLMLATDLVHSISEHSVVIAGEGGYPYIAKPIREGGLGFDLTLQTLSFTQQVSMEQIPEEESKY